MGRIVKLVGSGIGLAAEAYHASRSSSDSRPDSRPDARSGPRSGSGSDSRSGSVYGAERPSNSHSRSRSENLAPTSSSPAYDAPPGPPPGYAEMYDESAANGVVRSGRAEPVPGYPGPTHASGSTPTYAPSPAKSKAKEAGYDDDDESDTSSDSDSYWEDFTANDEEAWALDDMEEHVAPPAYEDLPKGSPQQQYGKEYGQQYPQQYGQQYPQQQQPQQEEPETPEAKAKKEEIMIRDMIRMAGPPPVPRRRIPCPVIIPQRRPGNKQRGFVRAYAPVLEECGIGQDVFLKFLKDWQQASKASPWLDAVMISASIAGLAPSVTAMVVTTVVQVVAGAAREMQARYRHNTFLDRVNENLFMPRGLFAMVMEFKDEMPGQQRGGAVSRLASGLGSTLFASEKLDVNQTVAKYSRADPGMSALQRGMRNMRVGSGQTHGEIELPEAAPLVYPYLDRAADRQAQAESSGSGSKSPAESGMKDKFKNAGKFVADYMDRRAQAKYEAEHPNSAIAVPSAVRPQFHSRFADPTHPVNNGSLVSLLSGGYINLPARPSRGERRAQRDAQRDAEREERDMRREGRDWARYEERNARRLARGKSPRRPPRQRSVRSLERRERRGAERRQRRAGRGANRGGRGGGLRKIMHQNVLYLLIVNLPSEDEVRDSVAKLEHTLETGAY